MDVSGMQCVDIYEIVKEQLQKKMHQNLQEVLAQMYQKTYMTLQEIVGNGQWRPTLRLVVFYAEVFTTLFVQSAIATATIRLPTTSGLSFRPTLYIK